MNAIGTVLAFLLALGPLILFHELGHYTVARLCGVKVLRFSLGMGRVVWSRRFGADRTEWAISILPLGGYVKMLDRRDPDAAPVPEHELRREFTGQSVWRRIAIVAAGPLANFLLAVVVFAGLYMHGIAEPAARIRFMAETTDAWRAGLRGGDLIVTVNGAPVAAWSELRFALTGAALEKGAAELEVARADGAHVALTLPAAALAGLDVDGDVPAQLGIEVARPPALLTDVMAGGPGERAGLRGGDVIVAIDGRPVADGLVLIEMVHAAPGRALAVDGLRAGQPFALSVTPERDPLGQNGQNGRIRVVPALTPEMVTVAAGPVGAVDKAARATWNMGAMQLRMIGKMLTGEVSWKNVTGPITIADYAGQTARGGPTTFLRFIAFISISLGVMNLLPIPVLDGGLLLYYSLEVLTGRPLPERIGEWAQRAGLGLLIMLMALAVFNDVARLL